MQYCEHCRVSFEGRYVTCPLCRGTLRGAPEPRGNIFPLPEDLRRPLLLTTRIVLITFIALAALSLAVNYSLTGRVTWSGYVMAGSGCALLLTLVGLRSSTNVLKTVVKQAFILTVLALLWDWAIGWRGWSLAYVYPSLWFSASLLCLILSLALRLPSREYMIYRVLSSLFGLIPVIFLLTGVLTLPYPSIVCAAASLLLLAVMFVFQTKNVTTELHKKFHL